jgi:hypothetical protein
MKHNLIINSEGKAGKRPHITGVAAFAAAMAMSLRRRLDYAGIARKALHIEPLPPGALPTYDRDIDVSAVLEFDSRDRFPTSSPFQHNFYHINKNGKAGRKRDRVILPTFETYSNPTIKIADVKRRRFNLIDRHVQTARQQLMSQEDNTIFKALDDVGKDDKNH